MLASSRVNPLLQYLQQAQGQRGYCGSGFTREEASAGWRRLQNQRSFFLRPRVRAGRISPASKPAPAMLPPYTM
ncbi:hypothetical protein EFK07_17270 [Pseudomonas putida]|uniref:Uncharacterized protein n=1 Tax=Pseudomonas putida TaxID=303 RepID=A0A3M8T7N8_PSEPU|nr:hypothetical protein EFK07_17270 [Pseudomonas putida]